MSKGHFSWYHPMSKHPLCFHRHFLTSHTFYMRTLSMIFAHFRIFIFPDKVVTQPKTAKNCADRLVFKEDSNEFPLKKSIGKYRLMCNSFETTNIFR